MREEKSKGLAKISEGLLLEYRAKRLLYYMGYFAVQGIIIKTDLSNEAEEITDLDVFGIYIHKDFRNKTVWLDCKSGFSKPLERISWIKGVKDSLQIDDAIFINRKLRLEIRKYANKSAIQIFDKSTLDKIENSYNINKDNWLGSWNPHVIEGKLKEFSKLSIPDSNEFKKISTFLSFEYWALDKYTQLKKCITALRILAKTPYENFNEEEKSAYLWGVYQLTNLFTLSILKICKELYYFEEKDRKEQLLEGILSSDIPIERRNEIYKSALNLAFEMIKNKYPKAQFDNKKDFNIVPPNYFEAINDLVSRVINNPNTYFDILRSLDLLLMEFDLNNKEVDKSVMKSFCSSYNENEAGLKTIFHLISQITNIPREYYQLIN